MRQQICFNGTSFLQEKQSTLHLINGFSTVLHLLLEGSFLAPGQMRSEWQRHLSGRKDYIERAVVIGLFVKEGNTINIKRNRKGLEW